MIGPTIVVMEKMPNESQIHLLPEEIRRYSAGAGSENEKARWEEHLLVCAGCRLAVSEQDYAAAMQSAARELRRSGAERALAAGSRISIWILAAVLLAILAIVAIVFLRR